MNGARYLNPPTPTACLATADEWLFNDLNASNISQACLDTLHDFVLSNSTKPSLAAQVAGANSSSSRVKNNTTTLEWRTTTGKMQNSIPTPTATILNASESQETAPMKRKATSKTLAETLGLSTGLPTEHGDDERSISSFSLQEPKKDTPRGCSRRTTSNGRKSDDEMIEGDATTAKTAVIIKRRTPARSAGMASPRRSSVMRKQPLSNKSSHGDEDPSTTADESSSNPTESTQESDDADRTEYPGGRTSPRGGTQQDVSAISTTSASTRRPRTGDEKNNRLSKKNTVNAENGEDGMLNCSSEHSATKSRRRATRKPRTDSKGDTSPVLSSKAEDPVLSSTSSPRKKRLEKPPSTANPARVFNRSQSVARVNSVEREEAPVTATRTRARSPEKRSRIVSQKDSDLCSVTSRARSYSPLKRRHGGKKVSSDATVCRGIQTSMVSPSKKQSLANTTERIVDPTISPTSRRRTKSDDCNQSSPVRDRHNSDTSIKPKRRTTTVSTSKKQACSNTPATNLDPSESFISRRRTKSNDSSSPVCDEFRNPSASLDKNTKTIASAGTTGFECRGANACSDSSGRSDDIIATAAGGEVGDFDPFNHEWGMPVGSCFENPITFETATTETKPTRAMEDETGDHNVNSFFEMKASSAMHRSQSAEDVHSGTVLQGQRPSLDRFFKSARHLGRPDDHVSVMSATDRRASLLKCSEVNRAERRMSMLKSSDFSNADQQLISAAKPALKIFQLDGDYKSSGKIDFDVAQRKSFAEQRTGAVRTTSNDRLDLLALATSNHGESDGGALPRTNYRGGRRPRPS